MDVDIISCGPSAKLYKPTGNKIIAVNAAVTFVEADYWIFGDYLAYELYKPIGIPTLVTFGNSLRKLPQAYQPSYVYLPEELRIVEYSFLAAISFAIDDLFATKITVYGDDKQGEIGIDDITAEGRTEKRWRNELELQTKLEKHYDIQPLKSDISGSYVYLL